MTPELLIGLAWRTAVCAALTLAALRLMRRRSAAERSHAAHLGLLAVVLTPLAATTLPNFEMAAPSPLASVIAAPPRPPAAAVSPTPRERRRFRPPKPPLSRNRELGCRGSTARPPRR